MFKYIKNWRGLHDFLADRIRNDIPGQDLKDEKAYGKQFNTVKYVDYIQYSGSVIFWYGSGSSDPYLWLMDPTPDPVLFVSKLQNVKKNFFSSKCLCFSLF